MDVVKHDVIVLGSKMVCTCGWAPKAKTFTPDDVVEDRERMVAALTDRLEYHLDQLCDPGHCQTAEHELTRLLIAQARRDLGEASRGGA